MEPYQQVEAFVVTSTGTVHLLGEASWGGVPGCAEVFVEGVAVIVTGDQITCKRCLKNAEHDSHEG